MLDNDAPKMHSVAAEQSVLGGIMLKNDMLDVASEIVDSSDFFSANHALIFSAMQKLWAASSPLDLITLADSLGQTGELEGIGGLAYLGALARDTPSAHNVGKYAELVRSFSVKRKLQAAGFEIARLAGDPGELSQDDLLEAALSQITSITDGKKEVSEPQLVGEMWESEIDRLSTLLEAGNATSGTSTGFFDLDAITSGLSPQDLIILAARPSMGKTSLAMNIAEHISKPKNMGGIGGRAMVFSMEMSKERVTRRCISSLGRINAAHLLNGRLEDHEYTSLTTAGIRLGGSQIIIDDTGSLTLQQMRTKLRRQTRKEPLDLIIVDYLQLMRAPEYQGNRVMEITAISQGLKAVAKDFDCPVIALSQLNRSLESRPDKRPIMSDLRDSGSIEQDADIIAFIYRDEKYNPDSQDKGLAEIIVAKNRNGETDTCKMRFLGQFTKFENIEHGGYADFKEDVGYF